MKVTIRDSRNKQQHTHIETVLDNRLGAWGKVTAICSEDNTADVILENGVFIASVPVASKEWVVAGDDAEKKYNSGERDLPPINARVFVFMPTRTYSDCFIAPFSGFITIDRNISTPFMEEEKEKIKERIVPNGWHITDDYVTGSHKAVSPDKKTSLEIDYGTEDEPKEDEPELHLNLFDNITADVIAEKSVTINAFDEVSLEHKKGDQCKITAYDTEVVIKDGDVQVKTTKQTITTDDIDIKSTAPIGMNDGLFSTGLDPYMKSETSALTALEAAAQGALVQLGILDGFSGGAGTVVALASAIVAFCNAMKAADSAAQTAIAKVAK